jgi:sucrose phosphorylase
LAGVKQTGRNRTINRQKFMRSEIETELANPQSLRSQVFSRYQALLRARSASPAFDPHGAQQVIQLGSTIFALLRASQAGQQRVLCLQSVAGHSQPIKLDWQEIAGSDAKNVSDLVTGRQFNIRGQFEIALLPYQTLWLTA